MRVIEQLVQHFWSRGAISRDEALYLVKHGFVRDHELPGLTDAAPAADEPDDWFDPRSDPDNEARLAEQLEDELTGRNAGSRKSGGKKKKPTGHNLAPAAALLGEHFSAREPYPALLDLGNRVKPCATWGDAAAVIGAARLSELEPALAGLLNGRPRVLGELWYWFDLEPLFGWAEHTDNAGPVADGLAKLMRASNRNEVGRAGQLMKAPEFRALDALLTARRKFLQLLPLLYANSFASLGKWLVPPSGAASECWPALPWAFVIVYNAKAGTHTAAPPGYAVSPVGLHLDLLKQALATAYAIDTHRVRALLIPGLRNATVPVPDRHLVFDRPLSCPLTWRV